MKVTNWRKKLAAAIVAAGIFVPGVARAINISVPDSDFKAFTVPAAGYAYADTYRPTSPWVDDLEHTSSPYVQDNASSNWLYNAAYSDFGGSTSHYRGAPRSGANDQAMHGFFRYTGQELTAKFQASTTYTLSVWAQGDADANNSPSTAANKVYLYIFDADGAPFSEASSLTFQGFQGGLALGPGVDFKDRASADHTASLSNWTQLSISYSIPSSSTLIGKRIGIGFYVGEDAAIDDVSLSSVPEPTTMILVGIGGLTFLGCRRRS